MRKTFLQKKPCKKESTGDSKISKIPKISGIQGILTEQEIDENPAGKRLISLRTKLLPKFRFQT